MYNKETARRTEGASTTSVIRTKHKSGTWILVRPLPLCKSLHPSKTYSLLYKMEGLNHVRWSLTFLWAPKFHEFSFNHIVNKGGVNSFRGIASQIVSWWQWERTWGGSQSQKSSFYLFVYHKNVSPWEIHFTFFSLNFHIYKWNFKYICLTFIYHCSPFLTQLPPSRVLRTSQFTSPPQHPNSLFLLLCCYCPSNVLGSTHNQ